VYKTIKGVTFHTTNEDGYILRGWINCRSMQTSLEIPWRKKVSPGFRLHFGDRGSETPVDIMLSFYWIAFFWSLNFKGLGDFCEKIGRGHKRNISLRVYSGQLWWELWHDDDGGHDRWHRDKCDSRRKPKIWPWSRYRDKHRSWMCLREGNIDLNPLTVLWGARYYHYETIDEQHIWVHIDEFPGDRYHVRFKLQKQTRYREHGPKWAERKTDEGPTVDWWHTPGIPTQNHSWKGDNTLGSGFSISDTTNWEAAAVETLIKWVKEERVKRNYRPRLEEDLSD